VQSLAKGTSENQDLSFEERADRLNQLFLDKIVPFYRELIVQSLQSQYDEQLTDF